MMLERGIEVSHEAIRLWTLKFGAEYARRAATSVTQSIGVIVTSERTTSGVLSSTDSIVRR
jgi:transposase-like protein